MVKMKGCKRLLMRQAYDAEHLRLQRALPPDYPVYLIRRKDVGENWNFRRDAEISGHHRRRHLRVI